MSAQISLRDGQRRAMLEAWQIARAMARVPLASAEPAHVGGMV